MKTAFAIGASARSPAVAAQAYNVRAVSTLGYVAQLAGPPDNIDILDVKVAHKMIRFPPQSVRRSDLFRLDSAGGTKIISAETMICAARTRAACDTLSTWGTI